MQDREYRPLHCKRLADRVGEIGTSGMVQNPA
jgi:hypothetical protein